MKYTQEEVKRYIELFVNLDDLSSISGLGSDEIIRMGQEESPLFFLIVFGGHHFLDEPGMMSFTGEIKKCLDTEDEIILNHAFYIPRNEPEQHREAVLNSLKEQHDKLFNDAA